MKNVIQACWLEYDESSFCEYCHNNSGKTYIPFHKYVINPAHICEECIIDFNVVDWYIDEKDYERDLQKLRDNYED